MVLAMVVGAILVATVILMAVLSTQEDEAKKDAILGKINKKEGAPLDLVTITGENLADADVEFTNDDGYQVRVTPVARDEGSLTVAVPPVIAKASGGFSSGRVDVSLISGRGGGAVRTPVQEGFAIGEPARPMASPGRTTLAYLRAGAGVGSWVLQGMTGTSLDEPTRRQALQDQVDFLNGFADAVESTLNASSPIQLGTLQGRPVVLRPQDLDTLDRAVLALLASQAAAESGPTVPSARLAGTATGCQAQEARSLEQAILENPNPDPKLWTGYFSAPTTSPVCKAAASFHRGYQVFGGFAAVGIGLAALAGAPAYALALPTALVVYLMTAGGAGTILVGGMLGAETPGAFQLVHDGWDRMLDGVQEAAKFTIDPLLPDWTADALDLGDVAEGASKLHEAFSQPIEPPEPRPPPRPYSGPFSATGAFVHEETDCTWTIQFAGSLLMTLEETPDGAVTGTGSAAGTSSWTMTGGTSCTTSSQSFDYPLQLTGTSSSFDAAYDGSPAVQFHGWRLGTAVSGTVTFDYEPTSHGSASDDVLLHEGPVA